MEPLSKSEISSFAFIKSIKDIVGSENVLVDLTISISSKNNIELYSEDYEDSDDIDGDYDSGEPDIVINESEVVKVTEEEVEVIEDNNEEEYEYEYNTGSSFLGSNKIEAPVGSVQVGKSVDDDE